MSTTSTTRPAFRAGQFYPGHPDQMGQMADQLLARGAPASVLGRARRHARAIMLPHAGWVYCGQTIGKTLGRVYIPDTVVVLGPRHTPYGANHSIAPHEQWAFPGFGVPIATDLVERLATLHPELQREPEAHAKEHGTEVLVPFLQRMNPNVRVVPVVLGKMSYDDTGPLAHALATVIDEAKGRILLVISSDMNHFAPDAENRRRDQIALQQMVSGNPQGLYTACREHEISMCGMLPAVAVMRALQAVTPAIRPELVEYSTSAKASGDTSRVVGYAGVVIE